MGPPVVTRRWDAAAGQGRASPTRRCTGSATCRPPSASQAGARVVSQLQELGWQPQAVEGGFAAGQPQYNFWIPLRDADGEPRTEDDVLAGMNQQWRRNIKKAAKAGVEVTRRRPAERRPHGVPRPLRAHRRARPLHAAAAGLLPDHVRGAAAPRSPTGSGSTSPATRATWSRRPSRSGSAATPGTPTAPPPPRSATSAAPTPSSGR